MGKIKFSMNFYYSFFYMISLFARTINKKNENYTDSAYWFVTLCHTLSIMIIFYFVEKKFNLIFPTRFIGFLLLAFFSWLNYYFLMKNDNDKKIIDYFDNSIKCGNRFNKEKLFSILYVLLIIFACIYLAW